MTTGTSFFSFLAIALSVGCMGKIAADSIDPKPTPTPTPSPAPPPSSAIAAPPPTSSSTDPSAATDTARQALVGRSFRVRRLDIGGGPPGAAPSNEQERVEGDLMKVCFGTDQTLTACQCDAPELASVSDIGEGGHPVDRCGGELVCSKGTYHFDSSGRLRVSRDFDTPTSLLWPVIDDTKYQEPEAGRVTTLAEGTFVTNLCGLGDALLEPISDCTP